MILHSQLTRGVKLGSTEVTCEGYSHKNDLSVLKGSCAVEYRLLLTDAGEEKYGTGDTGRAGSSTPKGEGLNWTGVLCIVIFIGALVVIYYSLAVEHAEGWHRNRGQDHGRGGSSWFGANSGSSSGCDSSHQASSSSSSQSSKRHRSTGFGSTSRR
jgi:hypothetical protein